MKIAAAIRAWSSSGQEENGTATLTGQDSKIFSNSDAEKPRLLGRRNLKAASKQHVLAAISN
jgi:hypothetical protein